MLSATSLLAFDVPAVVPEALSAPVFAWLPVLAWAPVFAWAPDVKPAHQANPFPPLVLLVLGAVAVLLVTRRAPRLETRPVQGQPAPPRQPVSRAVAGLAVGWALLLLALVVTCAIVGDDGLIRFSGNAFTVGGESYYGSVTAEGFPSWSYAISVVLGLLALGGAVFVAVRRGQAWLATVIAHVSAGAALTMAAIAAASPITELTFLTTHSPEPPPWTAVGPALMVAAYVVLAITVALSTFVLVRRRPAPPTKPLAHLN